MMSDDASLLVGIRRGDASSWERLIAHYEGRLLAFVRSRLHDDALSEDIVQEAFLGFLVSLPNYDPKTPLESFLFTITAHKLTDALRKLGRRPVLSSVAGISPLHPEEPHSRERKASSLARSRESQLGEQQVLTQCLRELIQSWFSRGEFERLGCIELLFVLGWSNREVAKNMKISEQSVANHKSFVVGKLKEAASAARIKNVDWTSLIIEPL